MKFDKYITNTKFRKFYKTTNFGDSFDNMFNKEIIKKPVEQMKRISDKDGLEKAYKHGDYHINNKTLYVAGSHTLRDWWDDFTKVPFYGDLSKSARYMNVEKVLKENPQIENLVGHSLGSSVSYELQKNHPDRNFNVRSYGGPIWDPLGIDRVPYDTWKSLGKPDYGFTPTPPERYRNFGDIVSIFDDSATNSLKLNPFDNLSSYHTYRNIADDKYVEEDFNKDN